jgi:hypothetical protein
VIEGKGQLIGSNTAPSGTWEVGILRVGPSAAARGVGFVVKDVELFDWHDWALGTQYVHKQLISGCRIHDCGFGGILPLSGLEIRIFSNELYNFAGRGGNAYGINLSHDSANYKLDPQVAGTITNITQAASAVVTVNFTSVSNPYSIGQNLYFDSVGGMTQINGRYGNVTAVGGSSGAWTATVNINSSGFSAYTSGGTVSEPRQATNPFCIDAEVAFNLVHDIPIWGGIICHGAYETRIHNNAVYNCFIGIQCSGSSGDAMDYAGENNSVTDNIVSALQTNGNASTVTQGYTNGITVNGGSNPNGAMGFHRGVVVSGNNIFGIGDPNTTYHGMSIQASNVRAGTIANNVIRNGLGRGIYGAHFDGAISGNLFAAPGQTANATCIYLGGSNGECAVNGNKHSANGGNAYAVGIDMNTTSATNVVCCGNDMSLCATPLGSGMSLLTRGISDLPPRVQVTSAPPGGVVNLSALGQAPGVWVDLEPSAAFTLTGFSGSTVGQRVHISQLSNVTVTVNDGTGALKLVGGTAAMNLYSTMEFLCVSTSNPTHLEKSRALGLT